jgi:hypothetical protein
LFRKPSRTNRLVLAGALCAALAAGGCGGNDEEEYRDDFNEAAKTFEKRLTEAGTTMREAGQAKSRARYAVGVEQLQTAGEEFRDDLDDLDPPEDAETKQRGLASAIDQFSTAVGSINAAVQADDESAIQAEAARVQAAGERVDDAIKQVKEAVE